jgi:hypothetical protein
MKKKFPKQCPSCESTLQVSELCCETCQTKVSGQFPLPILSQLPEQEQEFILQFFISSGSLKDIANQLGISYPTVRNKLDDMILKINTLLNS